MARGTGCRGVSGKLWRGMSARLYKCTAVALLVTSLSLQGTRLWVRVPELGAMVDVGRTGRWRPGGLWAPERSRGSGWRLACRVRSPAVTIPGWGLAPPLLHKWLFPLGLAAG